MSKLFCVQEKTTKCYYLFASSEENCDTEAERIIKSTPNKFFELCPDINSYKIGEVNDFSVNIMGEIVTESGEGYNALKEDNFCLNTNVDKCVELLEKKLASKAKPKPKAKPVPQATDATPAITESAPKKGTRACPRKKPV